MARPHITKTLKLLCACVRKTKRGETVLSDNVAIRFYLNKKQNSRGYVRQVKSKFVDVNQLSMNSSPLEVLVLINSDVPNITARTQVRYSWILLGLLMEVAATALCLSGISGSITLHPCLRFHKQLSPTCNLLYKSKNQPFG